jgi:hypothetical protein
MNNIAAATSYARDILCAMPSPWPPEDRLMLVQALTFRPDEDSESFFCAHGLGAGYQGGESTVVSW